MIGIGNHYRHALAVWRWGFWFRVFGRGIYLAVDDGLPPLWSERHGFRRVYRFSGLKFQWLIKALPEPPEWYDE